MVHDVSTSQHVTADQIRGGFFEGWPNPPTPETHLRLLRSSSLIVLALAEGMDKVLDRETDQENDPLMDPEPEPDDTTGDTTGTGVVGFITALTDGVLAAHIPLLEVLPGYRRQGIGRELVRRLLEQLGDIYMIDVIRDPDLIPFYEALGLRPMQGAGRRVYGTQAGSSGLNQP